MAFFPGCPPNKGRIRQWRPTWGPSCWQQGEMDLAIRMFTRASAQQPSNARFAYCVGTALERAGKMAEAVKELKRSIELDPSQPDAYSGLAQLYRKAGRPAESRRALQEYLRFMPQNIQFRSVE